MKKVGPLLLTAALLLVTASSCASESAQKQTVTTTTSAAGPASTAPAAAEAKSRGNALVRFVHAIPGAAAVDVAANTDKVFGGAAYKSVSPYKEIAGGRTALFLRPAGLTTAQSLAEESASLDKGEHYTALALAGEANPAVMVVPDKLVPPPNGKARLRVIHLSPLGGKVDLYISGKGEPLLRGLTYRQAGDYVDVDPASGALEVRPEGEEATLVSLPNVNIQAGGIYTVILTGRAKATQEAETILIEDRFGEVATK